MSAPPVHSVDLGPGDRQAEREWSVDSWSPPPLAPVFRGAGRNVLLFVVTAASIYFTGYFETGLTDLRLVLGVLSIVLAHEMGHYVACRYHRVDASLPYFIPLPVFSLVGTLGAVIRIRAPFPNRRALFDIGIAGPLAGFLVCLPVLYLGVNEAAVVPVRASAGPFLGEPLLFQWAAVWLRGDLPATQTLLLGPLGLAAWFGLLLTGLNLIPVGQLDGGHVTYAVLRERSTVVFRIAFACCVLLIYYGPSWIVWSVLLFFLGRSHPQTQADEAPLGLGRVLVALVGVAVFAVSFVPDPLVGGWDMLLDAAGY